jgi:antitoxin component YwqK of YwqJK toxin-antitoxin module
MEMQYNNGEKTGTWKMWNESGELISERKYTAGT